MALDTVTKRKSAMQMGLSFMPQHFPLPDGSNLATQPERKLFLGLASAITNNPPPVGGTGFAQMLLRGVG